MYPETLLAMARIAEMKRELAQSMTVRRYEAGQLRDAARRARKRTLAASTGRLVTTIGRRRRRIAAAG
jgi:hypothetical protein